MGGTHQDSVEDVPREHRMHRLGHWLPGDHRTHKAWLEGVIGHVDANPKDLHPVLRDFRRDVEANTRLYLLANSMFEEIPKKKPYGNDPTGHKQVRDFDHMLQVLNHILTAAPEWTDRSYKVGMVGTPINALLDWPMGTPSGFAFFLDPEVNRMLKKILDAWGEYLSSPASAYVLDKDAPCSWFSTHGHEDLAIVANVGETAYTFEELFQCDPSAEHFGYRSWDDFFTRRMREDKRPVACPEDDNVVANACESKPYNVARDIKERDRFWAKGQPYSVADLLAHDDLYSRFVGGTIYQAFLSALSYHRWHAPVGGRVVKAYVQQGTYYSEPLFEGLGDPDRSDIERAGEASGQGYLTATATRAIIFIESDSPDIGLMCFLGIGMTEVSTCDVTVKEGQKVKKGDEIGMFHFGGSSHCLVFRKGVDLEGFPELGREHNVPVRSRLAVVKK